MKKRLPLLALLVLTAACPAGAQTGKPRPAQTVLGQAVRTAKASQKTVLVIFHASWCVWCRRLEAFMREPTARPILARHYVPVMLDVMEAGSKKALENPGGAQVLKDLGGEKAGLPYYVFLDAKGAKLADSNVMSGGQNLGYPGAPEEIDAFAKLLQKTAPRMTETERAKLVTLLHKLAPASPGH